MINEKYELPPLDEESQLGRRLLEVEFYITFMGIFEYIVNIDTKELGQEIIEKLCDLCKVDRVTVMSLYKFLSDKPYRPYRYEIVLLSRYRGLSYRDINKLFGYSHSTIKSDIKNFLDGTKDAAEIKPRLLPHYFQDLKHAVEVFQVTLIPCGRYSQFLRKKSH